jgi:hypothetical protein
MRRTSAWGWWAFVVVLAGCPVVDEAVDADADGWPVPEDCDDGDWSVNPGAEEACGGGDEDCDGSTDEADAAGTSAWYADGDGDGFGAGAAVSACVAPSGHVAADGDCDDVAAGVNPGAAELCGGGDEDCDGSTDEADAAGTSAWYADGDGDGYGAGAAVSACAAPSGHVATDGDCDDVAAGVNPGAAELCGGGDEDCDRSTDEADAAGTSAWYADGDGDGYGAGAAVSACTAPAGHLATDGDCDDVAADVNPGAAELCGGRRRRLRRRDGRGGP